MQRRCSVPVQCLPASSIAHRHPRWLLERQRRTGQDGKGKNKTSNTALLSPAKLVPTDPGPRPSRRGHRQGRVSGQLPPTHRRRARTSRPRPAPVHNLDEPAVVRCHGLLGPGTCSPTPARRSTRVSAMGPRLHTQHWAIQARTGNELARHCTTATSGTSASSGSEAVVWAWMGSATGSFDLREGFASILRSSLAQLACDVVASRMKRGRVH